VIEDESHNIGQVYIPKPVFDNFRKGKRVILKTSMKERVDITFEEYVVQALTQYEKQYGDNGAHVWYEDADAGLDRIKKRLGNERHHQLKSIFEEAFLEQEDTGNLELHKTWIEILLREYYDPMYDYQIKKSEIPIAFTGNYAEVLAYLKERG